MFDAEGRLVQWWTNETSVKFDEKASCFVKQYSNFTMIDEKGEAIHVNGKYTLGENLADNGGLGEAYVAWKQRYDSDRESKVYNNVRLPGLDSLTPEQLFFVNFGRIWCNKVTPAQAKKGVSNLANKGFFRFLFFFFFCLNEFFSYIIGSH